MADSGTEFNLLAAWRGVVHSRLSSAEKLAAIALIDHHPSVWPSMRRLATMTGLCERVVRKAVRALQLSGAIAAEHRNGVVKVYALEGLMALECQLSVCRWHGRTADTAAPHTAVADAAVADAAVADAAHPGTTCRPTPAPRADEVNNRSNQGESPVAPASLAARRKARKPREQAKADPDARAVHEHWKRANGVDVDPLTEKQAKLIKACRHVFSVEQICQAVDFASKDSWCLQTGNTGLGYVCKDAERIRSLLQKAKHQGSGNPAQRRYGSAQRDHGLNGFESTEEVRMSE